VTATLNQLQKKKKATREMNVKSDSVFVIMPTPKIPFINIYIQTHTNTSVTRAQNTCVCANASLLSHISLASFPPRLLRPQMRRMKTGSERCSVASVIFSLFFLFHDVDNEYKSWRRRVQHKLGTFIRDSSSAVSSYIIVRYVIYVNQSI